MVFAEVVKLMLNKSYYYTHRNPQGHSHSSFTQHKDIMLIMQPFTNKFVVICKVLKSKYLSF